MEQWYGSREAVVTLLCNITSRLFLEMGPDQSPAPECLELGRSLAPDSNSASWVYRLTTVEAHRNAGLCFLLKRPD